MEKLKTNLSGLADGGIEAGEVDHHIPGGACRTDEDRDDDPHQPAHSISIFSNEEVSYVKHRCIVSEGKEDVLAYYPETPDSFQPMMRNKATNEPREAQNAEDQQRN